MLHCLPLLAPFLAEAAVRGLDLWDLYLKQVVPEAYIFYSGLDQKRALGLRQALVLFQGFVGEKEFRGVFVGYPF